MSFINALPRFWLMGYLRGWMGLLVLIRANLSAREFAKVFYINSRLSLPIDYIEFYFGCGNGLGCIGWSLLFVQLPRLLARGYCSLCWLMKLNHSSKNKKLVSIFNISNQIGKQGTYRTKQADVGMYFFGYIANLWSLATNISKVSLLGT